MGSPCEGADGKQTAKVCEPRRRSEPTDCEGTAALRNRSDVANATVVPPPLFGKGTDSAGCARYAIPQLYNEPSTIN